MSAAVEYVDTVRRQQRAARHTVSLTLGVHGLALAGLAVANTRFEWHHNVVSLLVPCAVYLSLWLAVRLRRWFTGIGAGRDGFGVMAVVSLLLVVFFPFGSMAVMFAGPGAFLGLGLAVIGARQSAPRLWAPAIALLALSPLVSLYTLDNHVSFLGPQPGTVVLAVLAVALLAMAGASYRGERAALRSSPPL